MSRHEIDRMRVRLRLLVALLAHGVWVSVAVAQPQPEAKVARIGVLSGGGSGLQVGFEPFRQRLRELGYVEGRNITLELRNAEGRAERYPTLAAELVQLGVDVIVVQGNAALAALRRSTQRIPVVMAMIGDPVGAGFVASLAKPGGNITGLSNMGEGISAKWMALLKEAAPKVTRVGVLRDPANSAHANMFREIEAAGQKLGISPVAVEIRSTDALARVFSAMAAEGVNGLIILPDPMFGAQLGQIAHIATEQRLPAISMFREFAPAGGLMSYGPDFADNWRRAAEYVDRIVKGAKPADLPVSQPVKFELLINRKTARALGLTLAPSTLLRADQVIE